MNLDRYYRSILRSVGVKDHVSRNRSFSAVRRIEERLEGDRRPYSPGRHRKNRAA
ncbi:MAG: hypothetical protein ACRDZQ_09780 [Acidimicrobiales bacterium]